MKLHSNLLSCQQGVCHVKIKLIPPKFPLSTLVVVCNSKTIQNCEKKSYFYSQSSHMTLNQFGIHYLLHFFCLPCHLILKTAKKQLGKDVRIELIWRTDLQPAQALPFIQIIECWHFMLPYSAKQMGWTQSYSHRLLYA